MGDLDNAPMPPMGADDMGGEDQMADPMGGAPDDMGGEDPNAMGEEPPMDDVNSLSPKEEDKEVLDVANNLTTKNKAAWLEYGKSMENDNSEGGEMPQGDMPMESRRNIRNLIDEVINDVLDNREGTKRPEKKLPKQYRNVEMPFKSPF